MPGHPQTTPTGSAKMVRLSRLLTFLVRAFLRSLSPVRLARPTEKDAPVVADTVARVRSARPKTQSKAVRTAIADAEQIAEDFVQPRPR